jgi:HEAT repeat protein
MGQLPGCSSCIGHHPFLAVFQYRSEVFDPITATLRQSRYADAAGRERAVRELRDAKVSDSGVMPTLLGALTDDAPGVRGEVIRSLLRVVGRDRSSPRAATLRAELAQALNDRDAVVRARAACGLTELDVRSEDTYAALLRASRPGGLPEEERGNAIDALARGYGDKPEAQDAILQAMNDPAWVIRVAGIKAMSWHIVGKKRPPQEPLVQALFALLEDDVCWVRVEAATYVPWLRKKARPALPRLIHHLKDPHSAVRAECAKALGRLGHEAEEALPALRALAVEDSEPIVCLAARDASGIIEREIRAVLDWRLPHLVEELGDDDPEPRASAAESLGEFGPLAKGAVRDLIRALDDAEPRVRQAAASALGAIGPRAARATDKLTALARDDQDEFVRRAADAARRAIDPATLP